MVYFRIKNCFQTPIGIKVLKIIHLKVSSSKQNAPEKGVILFMYTLMTFVNVIRDR